MQIVVRMSPQMWKRYNHVHEADLQQTAKKHLQEKCIPPDAPVLRALNITRAIPSRAFLRVQ
jgi:hypothetical protein